MDKGVGYKAVSLSKDKEKEPQRTHNLHLEKNRKLSLSGALAVPVFNKREIKIKLPENTLHVSGDDLQIVKLDLETGNFVAEGKITDLRYGEKRHGLISRAIHSFRSK